MLSCVNEAELRGYQQHWTYWVLKKKRNGDLKYTNNKNDMKSSTIKHDIFELEEQQRMIK